MQKAVQEQLIDVKHKIIFLSGKGGVGRSTLSAHLSIMLADLGKQVALLDMNLCNPSIPHILGLEGKEVPNASLFGKTPVYADLEGDGDLAVMSMGFLLPHNQTPVIWRQARKNKQIKEFLAEVYWGDLDYLLVDMPPGTSDEHITMLQYLKTTKVDGAIIVTTPHEVSMMDARKSINFCREFGLDILGVVENMTPMRQQLDSLQVTSSLDEEHDLTPEILDLLKKHNPDLLFGFIETSVFRSTRGAREMCEDMDVPFLGQVPHDPNLGQAVDEGRLEDLPPTSSAANALRALMEHVLNIGR